MVSEATSAIRWVFFPAVFRTNLILLLSPLPPGAPGQVPDRHFPKKIGGLGRFRPGSVGKLILYFHLGLKCMFFVVIDFVEQGSYTGQQL